MYCGKDAKRKAILQGIAIENTGWKEAETARDFARIKHEGKMYDDETPSMTHIEGVASAFEDEHLKTIAYLHDIVEDTDVTIEEIRERFGEDVSRAVDAITRRKGEQYFDYIHRLKKHPEATQVKLADLHYNINEKTKPSLAKRNRKAIRLLTNNFEAEEIDLEDIPHVGLIFPSQFKDKVYIHNHYLIGTTTKGWWRVWDLDKNDWVCWNFPNFSLFSRYWRWVKEPHGEDRPEDLEYSDMQSFQDAMALVDWKQKQDWDLAHRFWDGDNSLSTSFITPSKRRALQYQMTNEENKMRGGNRGPEWIPNRIVNEYAEVIKRDMPCPTCGQKRFTSMAAAERHHFYCEKYGIQPQNGLWFTPMELVMVKEGLITKNEWESETVNQALWITGMAVILGMTIPLFLDNKTDKV